MHLKWTHFPNTQGSLKKWNFLICGRHNSQAPWPTRPKLVCGLLKDLAVIQWNSYFFFTVNPPPPPPLRCGVEKRRDQRNCANFFDPASSQHRNAGGGGGFTVKKKEEFHCITAKPFSNPPHRVWGASVMAPGRYVCHKLGSSIFWVTLACLDISSKKKCL